MKKIFFCLMVWMFLSQISFSQNTTSYSDFNSGREKITRNGMFVLGGWSLANIGYSATQYGQTTESEKYFHQMNLMWNSFNVLIVGGSLLAKGKTDLDMNKTMRFQMNTEKTFIANAALDLVYSTVGLYLTAQSKSETKNRDKFMGWGESLIMQGGFLFLFDSTMYGIHTHHGNKHLYPLFDKMSISTSGLGIKIGLQL